MIVSKLKIQNPNSFFVNFDKTHMAYIIDAFTLKFADSDSDTRVQNPEVAFSFHAAFSLHITTVLLQSTN